MISTLVSLLIAGIITYFWYTKLKAPLNSWYVCVIVFIVSYALSWVALLAFFAFLFYKLVIKGK